MGRIGLLFDGIRMKFRKKKKKNPYGMSRKEKIARKQMEDMRLQADMIKEKKRLLEANYELMKIEAKIEEEFVQDGEENPETPPPNPMETIITEVARNFLAANNRSKGEARQNRAKADSPIPPTEGDPNPFEG